MIKRSGILEGDIILIRQNTLIQTFFGSIGLGVLIFIVIIIVVIIIIDIVLIFVVLEEIAMASVEVLILL